MPDITQEVFRHFARTMHLGPEATRRILVKVRETLGRDLEALRDCLSQDRRNELPARLHKLKGDLSNIGLTELSGRAHALQREEAGRGKDELLASLAEIRAELAPLLEP